MSIRLSKIELIELVERIILAEEQDSDFENLISMLQENVPHPEVLDLIYHSKPELSAAEVVEKALSYKPIFLGYT